MVEPVTITARSVWLTAPRSVELRREVVPPAGCGEIRVRAVASGLSAGTELLVYRGEVPPDLPLDVPTLAGSFAFPIKYGYASVGRVTGIGPDVEGLSEGDHVFVLHPHQTAYVVPAGLAVRLPDGLDPLQGVFTANLETAVNVVLDAPLRLGETVVIFGQGIVGLLIAQLLRRAGMGRVIAVDPLERRRETALALGVDDALLPGDGLVEQVRHLTNGRGADIAIEASGVEAALQAAIDVVADEGTVVVVSWYGSKPVTLDLGGHFHRGRVRLHSSQVGRLNPALAPRWDHARRMVLVRDLLPQLRLGDLITHRFPLAAARDAYQLLDTSPGEALQVALTYDEE